MNLQAVPALLRSTPDLGHEVKSLNRLRVAVWIGMAPVVVRVALFTAPRTGAELPMRLLGAIVPAAGARRAGGACLSALGAVELVSSLRHRIDLAAWLYQTPPRRS